MTSRNFTWLDRSRVQTSKMYSLSHERNVQILPQDGVVRCFKRMRRSEQPHVLLHHIMDSKDWIPFLWRGWEWRGCLQWLLQHQCKRKCNFTLYGLPLHLLFQLASKEKINLAELERRTGISKGKLRRLKANGFKDTPHGLSGRSNRPSVLTGYESVLGTGRRSTSYGTSRNRGMPT